jgi:hypothetical protein
LTYYNEKEKVILYQKNKKCFIESKIANLKAISISKQLPENEIFMPYLMSIMIQQWNAF